MAIVTGGASGIGRATVAGLEAAGVVVAVFDPLGDAPVDVTDAAAVEAAVAGVRDRLGPVDIVVCAAGIAAPVRIDDPSYPQVWERVLAVNLHGTMHTVEGLRRGPGGQRGPGASSRSRRPRPWARGGAPAPTPCPSTGWSA